MLAVSMLGRRIGSMTFTLLFLAGVGMACVATDGSAQTRATITRDTDNPALAPFRFTVNTKNTADANGTFTFSLPAVPTGKRLAIQQVSYSGYSFTSLYAVQMRSAQTGGEARLSVGIPAVVVGPGNFNFYSYTTPATAYFDAGEIPVIIFQVTGANNSIIGLNLDVVITGYFVTL